MRRTLKVWLVRHGESTANAGLPSANHGDLRLTPRGEAQAAAVARSIAVRPDLLVSSPFLRARATADAIGRRWPDVPRQTWPIEEFSYLATARCQDTTLAMRRPWVTRYWEGADPLHVDGEGAESFAGFLGRLSAFRDRLLACDAGFVVAVGHGQFFRALLWGEAHGFEATPRRMGEFRRAEVAHPMANGEVVEWWPAPVAGTEPTRP